VKDIFIRCHSCEPCPFSANAMFMRKAAQIDERPGD
jgi:hypothetical protein